MVPEVGRGVSLEVDGGVVADVVGVTVGVELLTDGLLAVGDTEDVGLLEIVDVGLLMTGGVSVGSKPM